MFFPNRLNVEIICIWLVFCSRRFGKYFDIFWWRRKSTLYPPQDDDWIRFQSQCARDVHHLLQDEDGPATRMLSLRVMEIPPMCFLEFSVGGSETNSWWCILPGILKWSRLNKRIRSVLSNLYQALEGPFSIIGSVLTHIWLSTWITRNLVHLPMRSTPQIGSSKQRKNETRYGWMSVYCLEKRDAPADRWMSVINSMEWL